ncbi:hypothetical protein HA402_014284 [Bradysia odoriphaga]|nr:hypothetical protein HA402_014284 [Bradysia odoriphaga]
MSYSGSFSAGSKASFLSYDELIAKDLRPGDLIEIDRGSYNHWVMFVNKCEKGTHWCFHVTATGSDFDKKDAVMSSMSSVGSVSRAIACIKKHKLKDIIEDNNPARPSQARINNKIEEANRKKCAPRPIHEVIEDLEERKDQTVRYNLKDLNCEHYVTTWKYGAGWSRQVEKTIDTILVGTAVVTTFAVVGAIITGIFGLFSSAARHRSKDQEDDSDSE